MRAYIIDADLTEELYCAIEPHIVGEVLDAGYISYNGAEWTPKRTRIKDTRWDDGQCTWGCVCEVCGARFEHEHSMDMNYCPNCGAPITGSVCEYCGTIHAKEAEQVLIEVESDYTDITSWDGMEVFRVYHGPEAKVVGE